MSIILYLITHLTFTHTINVSLISRPVFTSYFSATRGIVTSEQVNVHFNSDSELQRFKVAGDYPIYLGETKVGIVNWNNHLNKAEILFSHAGQSMLKDILLSRKNLAGVILLSPQSRHAVNGLHKRSYTQIVQLLPVTKYKGISKVKTDKVNLPIYSSVENFWRAS